MSPFFEPTTSVRDLFLGHLTFFSKAFPRFPGIISLFQSALIPLWQGGVYLAQEGIEFLEKSTIDRDPETLAITEINAINDPTEAPFFS